MRLGLFAFALCALSACASGAETPSTAPVPLQPDAGLRATDMVPTSGLGPQQLQPGECGLFLWSKTDMTKFIFYSKATTGLATYSLGDTPTAFQQTGAGGGIFGQFNTRADYRAGNGTQITVNITPGEAMNGGQRVKDGLITTTTSDGWQTVLPIVGVRACQPS